MPGETKYQTYPELEQTSRPRYFDGQFLRSQDFVDEQRYHVDRLRRQIQHLRIAGVAWGLTVSPGSGPLKVAIAAGTAIDASGRQIVVTAAVEFTVPDPLPRPGNYVLLASFNEQADVVQGGRPGEPGTSGNTRFREGASFQAIAADAARPAGSVGLALLTIAAQGAVSVSTPADIRRYAGLRLAGEAGPQLTTGGDAAARRLLLGGDLAVSGELSVATGPVRLKGRLFVDDGVIQRGGEPIAGSELGLYSQVDAAGLRYVSKGGRHVFFNDGGAGTTADLTIERTGEVVARGPLRAPAMMATTSISAPAIEATTKLTTVELAAGTAKLSGRLQVDGGVIQRGGAAFVGASELGLYSQVDGAGIRYVHKGGSHGFYSDGGAGSTLDFTIDKAGTATARGDLKAVNLSLGGRIALTGGVIQRGGDPLTTTNDLGLYSQIEGNYVRYVSKNGKHYFYGDGGIGTTIDFAIHANGDAAARGNFSAATVTSNGALAVKAGGAAITGNVGITGALKVSGAITPSIGDSETAGIQFTPDAYGGGGDRAFIRYFGVAGEDTILRIGNDNDAKDSLRLWQAGTDRLIVSDGLVTIGASEPYTGADGRLLNVNGELKSFGGGAGFRMSDRSQSSVGARDWVIYAEGDALRFWNGTAGQSTWMTSNTVCVRKLQLHDKWVLSGDGDTESNDEWLRLKGVPGSGKPVSNGYYGGLAAWKLWSNSGNAQGSDAALKREVTTIESGLELIRRLRGVRFRWAEGHGDAARHIGVIAQEVEAVLPEAVEVGPEGHKGVQYQLLVAPLIEAVKEQQAQIEALRREVAELRAGR